MEDKKNKQEIDALLSEAMNKLTFEEREKQQESPKKGYKKDDENSGSQETT